MADLEELLIKVNSDLGDLGGIDSAVKALEGLRDFSAKAEKGARSLLGLSAAFVALNREGKNTTGISNLKNQVDSLIGILDKLANHTKNADKSIQQLSALGEALKKFAGLGESLKGLDGITKGVNDMVGVLDALGNLGSASKKASDSIKKTGQTIKKETDKATKDIKTSTKKMSDVGSDSENSKIERDNRVLERLVAERNSILVKYAEAEQKLYEENEKARGNNSKSGRQEELRIEIKNYGKLLRDLNDTIGNIDKGTQGAKSNSFEKELSAKNKDLIESIAIRKELVSQWREVQSEIKDFSPLKGGSFKDLSNKENDLYKQIVKITGDIEVAIRDAKSKVSADTETMFGDGFVTATQGASGLADSMNGVAKSAQNAYSNIAKVIDSMAKFGKSIDRNEQGAVFDFQRNYSSDVMTSENRSSIAIYKLIDEAERVNEKINATAHSHPEQIAAPSPADVGISIARLKDGIKKNLVIATEQIASFDASKIINQSTLDGLKAKFDKTWEELESEFYKASVFDVKAVKGKDADVAKLLTERLSDGLLEPLKALNPNEINFGEQFSNLLHDFFKKNLENGSDRIDSINLSENLAYQIDKMFNVENATELRNNIQSSINGFLYNIFKENNGNRIAKDSFQKLGQQALQQALAYFGEDPDDIFKVFDAKDYTKLLRRGVEPEKLEEDNEELRNLVEQRRELIAELQAISHTIRGYEEENDRPFSRLTEDDFDDWETQEEKREEVIEQLNKTVGEIYATKKKLIKAIVGEPVEGEPQEVYLLADANEHIKELIKNRERIENQLLQLDERMKNESGLEVKDANGESQYDAYVKYRENLVQRLKNVDKDLEKTKEQAIESPQIDESSFEQVESKLEEFYVREKYLLSRISKIKESDTDLPQTKSANFDTATAQLEIVQGQIKRLEQVKSTLKPINLDEVVGNDKTTNEDVGTFSDAISNMKDAMSGLDSISTGIELLGRLGEVLQNFKGIDDSLKSLNSVAMGIRNLIKAVAEAEGLNENSFGFIVHIKNALDTLANNSAGYGNIGSATTGLSKLLEALNSAKTIDLSKLDQLKAKMLELNNDEFKSTAHELSNSLKELNEAFDLLDNAHEGVIGGMGTITQGFTDAASGLYNVREQIEIISQDFDSVLSPVLNSRLIEILETFRSMNDSYKNVSGIAQGLGSLLAVLLKYKELGETDVEVTPVYSLLESLRALADGSNIIEEVSQKFEKFQGISDAMARLFNAMKYFAIPLDPNQHTVFSYLKGEIEKFNEEVKGKFDETRNLLYGFKGVFEALQKDSSAVKDDNLFVALKKQIEDFASLDVGANLKPIGNFLNGVSQIARAMQDGKGLNQSSPLFEDLKKQLNDLYDWTSRSGAMLDDFGKLANLLRSITDLVNTLGKGVTFNPDNNIITNVVSAINSFDDGVLAKAESISKTFGSLGTMVKSMQKLFWANTRNVTDNLEPIKKFVTDVVALKDNLQGIEKPISSLSRLMSTVGDASSKVSVEDNALKAIRFQIEDIAKFAPQIAEAEKAIGNLTKLVDSVAASNKKVGDVNSLTRIAEGVKKLDEVQNVEKIGSLANNLTKLVDVMGKNQWDGRKNTAIDKIASGLKKFNDVSDLGKVSSLAKDIKKLIETVAQNEDKVGKDNVITRLVTSLQGFKDITEQTKGLKGTLSAIEKLIRVASEDIDFGKNNPLSQLKRILGGFSDINKGTKGLDKVIKSLMQAIEVMKMVNGKEFSIDPVNNPFALLKEQLEKFVDIIPALESFPKVLKSLKDFIKEFDSTKKFSVDPQPILNIIGAISYAQNLGGAVANFKEMISAIGKLVSKGDSNILAGIGQALGLINKNIAPFATTGKLQSLVDIANAIVKLKDVDVGKIKEIATAIRDIMSAIGQINGSNNTIKINLDERGIINADKGFQNAHRSWEDFKNDVLREAQDIDFSHMFDFDYQTPTKQLREDLKKAQQEMRNAQKEAQRWYESMKKTENIKTPEGAKNVEAYRRAYQNYWQAWTSAGKYKEIVEQLNRVLSARNGYELENDAQGYRARKSLTEERKRLTEMLESMSKNAPSLSVFGDEQGQSAALDTIYDRIRQIDQDLIGINEELPRVGESVEGIKVQTEQLSEVWDEVLKKQREARADISEGFGNFGGLLQGSGNKVLGSIGNLSSMFGKAVDKYGERFSESTIIALKKVASTLKTLTVAIQQVAAVVKVVVALFQLWWNIGGKMVDELKKFVQQCIDFAKKMLSAVVGAFNAVAGAVKKVASVVQSAAQLIQGALRKIGEFGSGVISVFGKIGRAVAPAIKGIKAVLSAVTPKFIKTLASGNLQLSKIIKNSHLLGGAIKKITQYFSMMSRMLMRKSITAFLNKMKQAFEDMVMFEKNSNDSMLNLNTNVSKVFSELRRAANQWIAAFEPLINAVAPHVVNFLANIQAMGENVAKFMAILTGQPYYLRAKRFYEDYGESLDETKKKAKDLTNGLDELNILNDSKDKDSTGINPEDMFEKVPVDGNLSLNLELNIQEILDKFKDFLRNIPWDEIKAKVREIVGRLMDIINTILKDKELWTLLGQTLAEMFNTVMVAFNEFIKKFNPKDTADALAALIIGALKTIDWGLINENVELLASKLAQFWNAVFANKELWDEISKAVTNLLNEIVHYFDTFAWTFDFKQFATTLLTTIKNILKGFNWEQLRHAVEGWVTGLANFFNRIAGDKEFWRLLGQSIANAINSVIVETLKDATKFNLAEMADSIATAIKNALEGIKWDEIEAAIVQLASNLADAIIKFLTDEQLLTDIATSIGKIGSTIIKALNTILKKVRKKAREIGRKIARALKKGFAEIPWDEVFTLPANIINTISAFFAGILDEIPSGTELANWITNKLIMGIDAVDWDLIYDNLMRLAEKLRDFISGVLQNGEFWQKAGEVTGKVITFTLDFLFELVNIKGEDLGTAIKNYINSLIDNVNIGKYLSKTVEIGIKLVTALDVVLTGVDWDKLGDQIAQGIVDAIDTIWKNSGLIQKTIEDAFSVVNNLIKQTLTKMLENDSFRKIGESIGKVLMGIINGLYEFFMLNGDLIIEGIGDLGKSLADFLRSHKAEIIAKLNGIINSLVDIINTIFDEKSELWTELYDIIAGLELSKLISVIVEKALRGLLATLKLREAVWEGVLKSGILEELWKTITEVAGLLWDWLKKKLFNSSNLFEALTSGGIVGFLKNLIRSLFGIDENGNWNIDLTGIFDGLKFIFSGFKSPITAMIDALKQLFDKDKQKNKGLLDGLFSGLFGNKEQDVPVKVTPTIDDKNIKPITIEDTKFGKISASAIEVTTIKAKELNVEKILAESLTLVDIFADVLHVGEIDTNSNFGHHEDEKRFGANDMGVESGTLSNKPEINASKITTPLLVADLIETDMLEAVEMQTNRIWSALLEVTKIVSDLLKVNTIQAKLLEVSKIVSNRLDVDRINADTLHLDDIYANTLHVGDIDGSISGLTDGIKNIPDDPTPTSFNWDYTPSITPIDWSDYIPSKVDWSDYIPSTISKTSDDTDYTYYPSGTRWSDTHDVPSAWEIDNVGDTISSYDWTKYKPNIPDTSSLTIDWSKYFPSGLKYPNVERWSDTHDSPSAWEIDGTQKPTRNINDYQDPMQYVHDRLMDMIGNENGVAGLMGNLFEESRFNPSNLQDSYEHNGMTDQKYVDWANANLDKFIKDGKGFGLMQVTDPSRKKDFVDQLDGRSVDDISAQLDFIEYELNHGFKNVKDYLQNATSPEDAADYVMRKYEKPQIQDSEESRQRGDAARNAMEQYSGGYYGNPLNLSDNTIDAMSGAITDPLGDMLSNSGNTIGGQLPNGNFWGMSSMPRYVGTPSAPTDMYGNTIGGQLPNGNFWGMYSMPRYEGGANTPNGLGINTNELLPSGSDFTKALKGVDWNKVFQKINWDKLLKKIDWNKLLQNVDLNKLLDKVDWEKIGEALADALNKNFKPEDVMGGKTDERRLGANDNLVQSGTLDNPALGDKQFPDGYLSEQDTHDIYARLRQIWDDTRQFLEDVKKLFEDFDFVDLFLGEDKQEDIKKALDDIVKMFEDFVKDVEDTLNKFDFAKNLIDLEAIEDLLEGAKDKIDSFLVTTKQAFDNFKKDIENLFDGLFDDAFKNLEKQAEDALKKVLQVVGKYVKKIKKKLDELKNAAKDIFKDLAKNGNDEWQKLYGYIELWVGAILEQIKKLKDAAKDMFKDLAKGVDEEWKKVADAVARHVKTILDEIAKLKDAANNLFADMVEQAKQQWQDLFDLVHEWTGKLIEEINRIHDTALNLFFGMDSAAEEEWNKLLELVRQKVADIIAELEKLKAAAMGMFDGLAEKADEQWKAVYDAVKRWIDEINKLLDDLKAKSLKLFEGMVAAAESDWQNLLGMIQRYVNQILAEMAKITDAAKKLFNGMVEAARLAWQALYDLINEWINRIINELLNKLKDAVKNLFAGMADSANAEWSRLYTVISTWVAKIQQLLDQLKFAADSLFNDMATNANTAFQNLYNIIAEWIQRIMQLFQGLTEAFRLAIDGMSDAMEDEMREIYDAIDRWLALIAELLQSFFANWNIGLADAVKRELDKAYQLIVEWVEKVKKLLEDVFGGLKALTDGKLEVFGTVHCECDCCKDHTHLDNNTKAKSENTRAVETLNNTVRDWINRCGDNTHLINNTNAKSKNTKAVEQLNNGIQDWINRCGDNTHLINNTNAKSKNTLATEKLITSISNLQGSLGSIKCECNCCGNCSGCNGGSKTNTTNNSSNTNSSTTSTVKNNTSTTSTTNNSTGKQTTTTSTSGKDNNTITKSTTSSTGGGNNNSGTKVTTPSTGGGSNDNNATKVTTPTKDTVDKSGSGVKTTATTGKDTSNTNNKDNTKSTSNTNNSGGGSGSDKNGTEKKASENKEIPTTQKRAVKYGTGDLITRSNDGKGTTITSEEQAKKYGNDVLQQFIKNRDAANKRVDNYRKEAEGLYDQIKKSKYYDKIKAQVDKYYKDLNTDANLAGDSNYKAQLDSIKSFANQAKEFDNATKNGVKLKDSDWNGKLFVPAQSSYNGSKTGYATQKAIDAANAANKQVDGWITNVEKYLDYIHKNGTDVTDKDFGKVFLTTLKTKPKNKQEAIAAGKTYKDTNIYAEYLKIKARYDAVQKAKKDTSKGSTDTSSLSKADQKTFDAIKKHIDKGGDISFSTSGKIAQYSSPTIIGATWRSDKTRMKEIADYVNKKKLTLGGSGSYGDLWGGYGTSIPKSLIKPSFEHWYKNRLLTKGYQMGGIPNTGEIFVARENGTPEFVGSFGNKTAVANNDQIVSAVANGVSMANDSLRNAIENQTNALENAIDRKNLDVQIGDRQIAEANRRGEKGLGQNFIS